MYQLITFLNENAGAIQALMAVLLVLITAYYAWQTRETVKTMQRAEEERSRPRMVVYLEPREEWLNFVEIVVANIGQGTARNVQFSFNQDLVLTVRGSREEKLSDIGFIKNGIPSFAPQRVIRRFFISLIGRVEELQKSNIVLTIKYSDEYQWFKDSFQLDFCSLIDRQVGEPPVYKIATHIERMSKSLEKIEGKISRK